MQNLGNRFVEQAAVDELVFGMEDEGTGGIHDVVIMGIGAVSQADVLDFVDGDVDEEDAVGGGVGRGVQQAAQGNHPDVVPLDEVLQVGRGNHHAVLGLQRPGVPRLFQQGFFFVELKSASAGDETDRFRWEWLRDRVFEGEEGDDIVVYLDQFGEALVEKEFHFGGVGGLGVLGGPG